MIAIASAPAASASGRRSFSSRRKATISTVNHRAAKELGGEVERDDRHREQRGQGQQREPPGSRGGPSSGARTPAARQNRTSARRRRAESRCEPTRRGRGTARRRRAGRRSRARSPRPARSQRVGSSSSSATRPASSISATSGTIEPTAASVRRRPSRRPAPSIAPAAISPTSTTGQPRRGSAGSSIDIQCSAPQPASAANAIARASPTGSIGSPPRCGSRSATRRAPASLVVIGAARA